MGILFVLAVLPYGQAACLQASQIVTLGQLANATNMSVDSLFAVFEFMCSKAENASVSANALMLSLQNYTAGYLGNVSGLLRNQTDSMIGNRTELLFANYTASLEDRFDIAEAIKAMAAASNFTEKLKEVDSKIANEGQGIEDKLTEMINSRTAGMVSNDMMQKAFDEQNNSMFIEYMAAAKKPVDYTIWWFLLAVIIVVSAVFYRTKQLTNVNARIAKAIGSNPRIAEEMLKQVAKYMKNGKQDEVSSYDVRTEAGQQRQEAIIERHKKWPDIKAAIDIGKVNKSRISEAARRSRNLIEKEKKRAESGED